MPGRPSKALRREQIEALQALRISKQWSYANLKAGIGAPCNAETLHKALKGFPVWDVYHSYLAQWCERFLKVPVRPTLPVDYKMAAANDQEPPENFGHQEPPEAQSEK